MNRFKDDLNRLDWHNGYKCNDAKSANDNFIAAF